MKTSLWVIALPGALAACAAALCQGTAGPAGVPPAAPTNAQLDPVVLEVALVDLATYTGSDSPMPRRGPYAGKVVFDPQPATYQQTPGDVLYRYRKELWEQLTAAQITAATQAAELLCRRLSVHDLPRGYRPKDRRIVTWRPHSGPGRDVYPDRPVRAWPPGYAKDRDFAVVRLIVPWSIHHAEATYLLEKRGTGWAIVLRQFVIYP